MERKEEKAPDNLKLDFYVYCEGKIGPMNIKA